MLNLIEAKDFDDILNETLPFKTSIHEFYKDVIKFYRLKNDKGLFRFNQIDMYRIVGDSLLSSEDLSTFEDFGVSSDLVSGERIYYVLIIEEGVQETNLPLDAVPTHLCVLSNREDFIISTSEKIKTLYPNIILMYHVPGESPDSCTDKLIKAMGGRINRDNCSNFIFDIEPYCVRLSRTGKFSADYVAVYKECISEIVRLVGKRFVYCSDSKLEEEFHAIVVELSARHGITYYNTSTYNSNLILNSIMCSLFDERFQLKEHTFKYVENLPPILLDVQGITPFVNIVKNKSLAFTCFYTGVEINSSSTYSSELLSLKDVLIVSLEEYYSLNTVEGCENLKGVINHFYRNMKLSDDVILDATRLLLFNKVGSSDLNIGVVIDFDVQVELVKLSIGLKENFGEVKIGYEQLKRHYPPHLFTDGIPIALNTFKIYNIPITSTTTKELMPSLCSVDYSYLVQNMKFNRSTLDSVEFPLLTYGLYCQRSHKVRGGFYKNFIEFSETSIEHIREQLDCFGGATPGLVNFLSLSRQR